jgi:serine/threonine protein kinase
MSEPTTRDALAPSESPLPAVPGFALQARLGRGTVATSYSARRNGDDAPLVLKLIHPQLAVRKGTPARLEKLQRGLVAIEHVHLVRFHGFGQVPGTRVHYAVRAWTEGEPITHALRREKTPVRQVVERFGELLSALAEAHRHGVLHLGLRPGNVLVEEPPVGPPRVHLCDLGLNRLAKRDGPDDALVLSAPDHLRAWSPEQLRGDALDGRSDVFAVGTLLYEVLTCVHPFECGTADDVVAAVTLRDLPAPSQCAPERRIPRELEAVCMRALRRDANDRFRSALEMSQALRACLEILGRRADLPLGPGFSAAPSPPTPHRATLPGDQLPSRTKLLVGAGLSALAGLALLVGHFRGPGPLGRAERLDAAESALALGHYDQALAVLPVEAARSDVALACARARALLALGREADAERWLDEVRSARGQTLLVCPIRTPAP